MKLLTNEKLKSYDKAKVCYIFGEQFEDKYAKDKASNKACKVRNLFDNIGEYRGTVHSLFNLKYSVTKELSKFLIMNQSIIIILS